MTSNPSTNGSSRQAAARLTFVSAAGNGALSAFKLFAGLAGNSAAMVADAVHSLSDLVSTFIAWFGVRAAHVPPDAEHPFGHERFENVAALLLGAVLAAAGVGIAWTPLEKLLDGTAAPGAGPEPVALAAAGASILVKEWMFRYARQVALRIQSQAFLADAWHHRSDALSSVGSLIGIGAGMMGFRALDSLAGIVISAFILKAAWDVVRDALAGMLDCSRGAAYEQALSDHIAAQPGVGHVDRLRTRQFGSRTFVELEIGIAAARSFAEAHAITEQVHASVEAAFPDVRHVMVHANPLPGVAAQVPGCRRRYLE